jgi:hypothetical protein
MGASHVFDWDNAPPNENIPQRVGDPLLRVGNYVCTTTHGTTNTYKTLVFWIYTKHSPGSYVDAIRQAWYNLYLYLYY